MQEYKKILREEIITTCKKISHDYMDNASNQIVQHSHKLLLPAINIAVYRAYMWEMNLNPLIQYCISLHKKVFQPIAFKHDKNMLLEPYCASKTNIFTLTTNTHSIDHAIKWYNLDLIFIPVVAVDKMGRRLGKGGGYYDTTLANIRNNLNVNKNVAPILCGVGYSCQLVEQIPIDVWDIRLDYFLSEDTLIKF